MKTRKPYDSSRRRFCTRLYALGFKRDDNDRDPILFVKIDKASGRKLEVQLWTDGGHRASHWIPGTSPGGWRMCTMPTDFRLFTEMEPAIERERTRTDHPPPIQPSEDNPVMVLI